MEKRRWWKTVVGQLHDAGCTIRSTGTARHGPSRLYEAQNRMRLDKENNLSVSKPSVKTVLDNLSRRNGGLSAVEGPRRVG